jgi:hypothetical protein
MFGSLKSMTFRLWDEQRRKLVGFREIRDLKRTRHVFAKNDSNDE